MTAPTDAEIDAVLDSNWPAFWRQATLVRMWLRDAVREAIAKWGQPAHSGEPVACGNCGGTGWMVRDPDIGTDQPCFVCDGSGGYSESAAPQPTQPQAGAVPLTNEQIKAAAAYHEIPIRQTRAFIIGARFSELHHGIKGGQHGTS